MIDRTLIDLALDFGVLSVIAFGGMIAALPEIQRRVIEVNGWMDERTFTDLYGLGYAMPGPNVLVATLIGYQVAGPWGALVATVAITLPAMIVAAGVARVWHRFRESRWRRAIQAGLLPIVVGLTIAGGYLIARTAAAEHPIPAYVLVLVTIAITNYTRIHPLWMIAIGAMLGLAGLV